MRDQLKVDPVVSELLLQRQIDDFDKAESFFRPKLERLHDPFAMQDMGRATKRLIQAIEANEKVMLYGDYDVDGTTAVSLLYESLSEYISQLDYYIPDRYSEGYGVSSIGVEFIIQEKFDLVITLDCGIKALDQIASLKSNGVDVIVCDHHRPGNELPDAIVLDPKRKDCEYPYKELSGCGVGFKLLQALWSIKNWEERRLFDKMDLVAVSIGADIVEVTGENRVLCYHGLKLLNDKPRIAFQRMIALGGKEFPLTIGDVIFIIAPRINAAGRLRSGRNAVELLISDKDEEITQLAMEINEDNRLRRELDGGITTEALAMLESEDEERWTNVVYGGHWHKGVIGIVASRIIENHYHPTVVICGEDELITGSARSVKDFDVHEALEKCSDLLDQFGGHKYAAGFKLKKENYDAFKQKFEQVVASSMQAPLRVEELEVDLEIDFSTIFTKGENRMKIPRLKRILSQFEPHGPGNMKPVFVSRNVYSTDVRLLKEAHLKLQVTQPQNDVVLPAIGFNQADHEDSVSAGMPFDIAYTLEVNRWNGRETIQLNLKDIRPSC